MVNAIFASKLYKNSKYKSKIQSAINDPINQELVKQLSSYLDDDTISELSNLSVPDDESENSDSAVVDTDFSDDVPDDEADVMPDDADDSNDANTDAENINEGDTKEVDDVESSESLESAITSTEAIMAMLNENPRTSGATRTCTKGNETWIYYNDDTNMNDILTDVIQCLDVDGCSDLEFNRLARSDNAIVFTSSCR